MLQDIKVSVICNTYNHGEYIKSALNGFVSQKTDFGFEVLIHDDASTDNTQDIIREYEKRYPDIIKPIYQTENQYSQRIPIGPTFQNPRIRGKYVAFCEGDDYWTDPYKLQKQYDFLEDHPDYSMCASSTTWLNMMTGRTENRGKIDKDRDISIEEIILEEQGRIFQFAAVMVKTQVWTDVPQWRKPFPIGDLPLALRAALAGKVRMLADNMSVYRYYSKGSWTQRMDNDLYRADISRKMIEGFEAFDRATGGKYREAVHRRIIRHRYTLALMTHDFKAIKNGELKEVYRSRPLFLRASDMIRCRYPKLYLGLRRISKRIIK